MIPSNLTPAQIAGNQLVSQINSVIKQLSNTLENGLPEIPSREGVAGRSAISAVDLSAALGSTVVTKLEAIITAAS